uniref:Uncharacterized protein n=1 Tax=Theileria annulata TaxID=5874 RepID=A0A3B0NCK7_THEAN
MYYCELIPRKNIGIINLKLIIYIKDYIISYNKINKLINFTNIITKDSFNIIPKYIYTNINNSYKFIISLNLPQHIQYHQQHQIYKIHENNLNIVNIEKNNLINGNNINNVNNLDIEDIDILIKLIYINKEGYKIIKNFNKDLEEFVYIINCKDLIILEDNLQEINIRTINNFHLFNFKISIKFHHQLTFISLLTNTINSVSGNSFSGNTVNSNTVDSVTGNTVNSNSDNSNTVNKVNSIIKCKNCENIIKELIDINLIILPSDLYLNSLNSIYCEECQFDHNKLDHNRSGLSKSDHNRSDLIKSDINFNSYKNIGFISDDNLIISNESIDKSINISVEIPFDSPSDSPLDSPSDSPLEGPLDIPPDRRIICENCNIIIGKIKKNKLIYKKNKISLIIDNFDIFYKFNDFIEIIEKIQFDPKLKLKLYYNSEVINIIKVSKQPDTFILNNNNPIITTRLLYKFTNIQNTLNNTENTVNSTENTVNSVNSTENTLTSTVNTADSVNVNGRYELNEKEFEHIKLILLIFSHDLNSNDWISSLLPQL